MTRLILIRHGESEYNLIRRYTGQTDVMLTDKGRLQAKITADYILESYKIDEIISSDLIRAIDTARPIADALGLEIKTDKRLREIYAGDWQGLLFADVEKIYAEEYAEYKKNRETSRTPNGEGLCDVQKRTWEAILDIAREGEGKTVLVSTHNGPLMSLIVKLYGKTLNETTSLSNNSVTEIEYENGEFRVIKCGYDEHLKELNTKFSSSTHN